jgi:hypothetical protein
VGNQEKYNVFISWSGRRSKWVAEGLRAWLPLVVQSATPWMSARDIDPGSRGLNEITSKLQSAKIGISCLTPENLSAPWLLYEAGALAKAIDDRPRLCTYLLAGLQPEDVGDPLGMFQATVAEKEATRILIHTINRFVGDKPLSEFSMNQVFEKWWPDLENKISEMPSPAEEEPVVKRTINDIAADLLKFARADAADRESIIEKLSHIENVLDRAPFGDSMVSYFSNLPLTTYSATSNTIGKLSSDDVAYLKKIISDEEVKENSEVHPLPLDHKQE